MNRKNFLTLSGAAILQLVSPFASAATGPTLKPTKLGQTIIWRNKKYTAIKSGKKLVWNKGVAVVKPKPTPPPVVHGTFDIDLAASDEVPEGMTQVFFPKDPNAQNKSFFVARENAVLVSFDSVCTHEGCQVWIGIPYLLCACHLSAFDCKTGIPVSGPALKPLKTYPVREEMGRIILTNTF
jgi:nitrite reductase/ring-hydroxylating ferredoxin subunit